MKPKPKMLEWSDFPTDFVKWKLNPTGCTLSTEKLGENVYALISSLPGVDNAGFIVGSKGVLVIDAHISIPMAKQIQERVREVTDQPIRYLVNTNYHADHTFGNCAFPTETLVIQQRETAARTLYFEHEREFMLPAVSNDPSTFEGVTYRAPDIVFDDRLVIDLGDNTVELHWFGPANTPGDTIVYVPRAKTAWTGNVTVGSFGLCLESDAPAYLKMISRFAQTLEVEKLVSGHAPISGREVLGKYLLYFSEVTHEVRKALGAGWSLEETLKHTRLPDGFRLPESDPRTVFAEGRHSYNVRRTYLSLADR